MVLVHVVALKFRAGISDERILQHFTEEVALQRRMPELVLGWGWGKNVSLDERASVNQGCQWVVRVRLRDKAALDSYQIHPEHVAVKEIQAWSGQQTDAHPSPGVAGTDKRFTALACYPPEAGGTGSANETMITIRPPRCAGCRPP